MRVCKKTYQGFTLIEMLVALFVFTLMMTATMQIFGTAFVGYRATRTVERDIENAQYAMNAVAKELRTGSVVSDSGNRSYVQFYDHSQGKCFRYRIASEKLQVASAISTGVVDCDNSINFSPSDFTTISTGVVTGSFRVTPSETVGGPARVVGKVTIALEIAENDTLHRARIQTTVSLRDFGTIDL